RYFDEGLAVAERQGAIHEHAQTLLARGQVGRELGWSNADADVAEATEILTALEAGVRGPSSGSPDQPVTLSLADRFDTVLDSGPRIASALSREAIFVAVKEAATKLLRCEHCLLLKVEGNPGNEDITLASGELRAEFSRSMVRRALAVGRAVAFVQGAPDNSSESVLLDRVRSALCAPIFVRGRPVSCFYVSHRQEAGPFRAPHG